MPYRDAEALIGECPELNLSTQNAHALLRIMVDCGGVEAEEVPEPDYAPDEEKQDLPVDYIVHTTVAGRAALALFDPARRFQQVLSASCSGFEQLYLTVQRAEGERPLFVKTWQTG